MKQSDEIKYRHTLKLWSVSILNARSPNIEPGAQRPRSPLPVHQRVVAPFRISAKVAHILSTTAMSYFIPPVNYGMVEEDLYRSGQPNELNFPFLERLHLKTIIYLALEEPNPQFQSFVEEQEIQLIYLGGNTRMESRRKAWEPLSEETVLAALDIILDRSNYPLYITCHLGRDRTGT